MIVGSGRRAAVASAARSSVRTPARPAKMLMTFDMMPGPSSRSGPGHRSTRRGLRRRVGPGSASADLRLESAALLRVSGSGSVTASGLCAELDRARARRRRDPIPHAQKCTRHRSSTMWSARAGGRASRSRSAEEGNRTPTPLRAADFESAASASSATSAESVCRSHRPSSSGGQSGPLPTPGGDRMPPPPGLGRRRSSPMPRGCVAGPVRGAAPSVEESSPVDTNRRHPLGGPVASVLAREQGGLQHGSS
jgi:hypothetical protein